MYHSPPGLTDTYVWYVQSFLYGLSVLLVYLCCVLLYISCVSCCIILKLSLNVYKYLSQSCEKLTDTIKHSTSGTFELIIDLNGMELLHNLHHCSQTLLCTIHLHTCFSCKRYFMNFFMCASSSTVCILVKVLSLIETWANFRWGRRRVRQG